MTCCKEVFCERLGTAQRFLDLDNPRHRLLDQDLPAARTHGIDLHGVQDGQPPLAGLHLLERHTPDRRERMVVLRGAVGELRSLEKLGANTPSTFVNTFPVASQLLSDRGLGKVKIRGKPRQELLEASRVATIAKRLSCSSNHLENRFWVRQGVGTGLGRGHRRSMPLFQGWC
ncbi:MAG: hypothetical protein IT175_07105 [Acidobacteria bacterium]|nr:hypothetical protein [Acidobacteriota bacterium]